jgi:acetyl esterase/lipase
MKISANKITISGDSAGGHLCLSLLRYIADNPDTKLPNPACAWLWSPWVNPGAALIPGSFSQIPHEPTDYLNEGFGAWGSRSIKPSAASGITLEHPNTAIQGNAFATPTPLFFSAGECEMLYYDHVKTYEQFRAVQGNKVRMEIERGAVHDIILIGHVVGFEKEAALGAKRAGEFLDTCT